MTWTLDDEGTLTISGEGDMADWWGGSVTPWYSYHSSSMPSGYYIKTIKLENGVTSIGQSAFMFCHELESIDIADSITDIGDRAFQECDKLTNITIPDKVSHIGDSLFRGCWSLKNVVISSNVISINADAFSLCGSLNITVDSNNKNFCDIDGVLFDKNKTELIRYAKDNIQPQYKIPDSVTRIGDSAFENCSSLTKIEIPSSIVSIGRQSFNSCTELDNITIPNSILTIGTEAFASTKYYNTSDNWEDGALYLGKYLLETKTNGLPSNYAIKNGTTVICPDAFDYAVADETLKIIEIPESVVNIETSFPRCKNLQRIAVADGNKNYISDEGVLYDKNFKTLIKYPAQKGGAYYEVHDNTKILGKYSFAYCNNIEKIIISDNVTDIAKRAFCGCEKIKTVYIPKSVTNIGSFAFASDEFSGNGFEYFTDVYYGGSKEDWEKINVGENNEPLLNAAIHYNSTEETFDPITPAALTVTQSGDGYTLTADTDYDGVAYAATYDGEGNLINVESEPFMGGTATVAPNTAGAAKIRFFVWTNTVQPLTDTVTKNL